MDTVFVTNPIWHDISIILRFLWLYLLFIIGFAFNILPAPALIPSLFATGLLPPLPPPLPPPG